MTLKKIPRQKPNGASALQNAAKDFIVRYRESYIQDVTPTICVARFYLALAL